jgi:AraC family transcriptional regulator
MSERGTYVSQTEAIDGAHPAGLLAASQAHAWHYDRDDLANTTGPLDPVVNHLRLAMLPALEKPERASKLFLDHVTQALRAYCAHTYGGEIRGGLAPWQLRRATEMLMEHLDEDISLSRVAKACELSISHFARAFRKTTGQPPHRWLICRRVERAKGLLRQSAAPMAQIALSCGFADQASFTRAFKRVVGTSPGGWRRLSRV